MNSILIVDKQKDISSFHVIRKLKRVIFAEMGKIKIGHAGTLDPFATGLLIILLGKATKKSNEFMGLDKEYYVTVQLGYETSTYDTEGEITYQAEAFEMPDKSKINEVLSSFFGKQSQMPPRFSAKKVGGVSAYKLAREGKEFELKPKEIEIYEIKLDEESIDTEQKSFSFTCKVSSGTYIRSLVADFGRKIGTYANAIELRRTKIADLTLENSLKSDLIDDMDFSEVSKFLINLDE